MKKNYKNLLIAGILSVTIFVGYSYVLVRSACEFGYSKGYEKGAVDGIVVGKAQAKLDHDNELEELLSYSDSIATRIVYEPIKRDTIVVNKF